MSERPRVEYSEQLNVLRQQILRLGEATIETIGRGTAAFLERDLGAAQELIDGDDALDVLTLEIEEGCYQMLALQAPMAHDLRLILASLKLASEFERSADLMVNICKASRRVYDIQIDPKIRGLITEMSAEASAITRNAVDAYMNEDAALAAALDDMDDRLDLLQVEFVETVFTMHHEANLPVRSAVQLALICRYYERIGDHAVNIGERVGYMVTGWLPEHDSAAREEYRLGSRASGPRAPAIRPGG